MGQLSDNKQKNPTKEADYTILFYLQPDGRHRTCNCANCACSNFGDGGNSDLGNGLL